MGVKEVRFIRGTTLGISNTGPGKEKKKTVKVPKNTKFSFKIIVQPLLEEIAHQASLRNNIEEAMLGRQKEKKTQYVLTF